ncbi:hypothetical protein JOE44_001966 [Chryseobacterium sp. PvR013]|uniref:hypothetical protein n=1 Tax=Chryseobacterium sp. PvR013 TaxID=2806595 RepID=UPI001AE300A9|nr:hypothetical protein [Chryseobacterium sp. PvR013]MBP1165082.1 hypothetical protein [Chryseobacterium sp. PvR013]
MSRLTIQQAIDQGYEYFVYPADGYQALKSLSDYAENEINWENNPTLCNKEPQHPAGMNAEELRDHLADVISDNHASETGCDTDCVFDAIKEIDFTDIAEKIQDKLNGINFFWQSEIALKKSV